MKIPGGTPVYIGPPAKPIPKQISDAIGTALGKIAEIEEAHLPMVYSKGHIDPPAQVLVVVLDEHAPSPQARIAETLGAVLPTDFHMDITELHPGDTNLPTIRATGTKLNLNRKVMYARVLSVMGIYRQLTRCYQLEPPITSGLASIRELGRFVNTVASMKDRALPAASSFVFWSGS